MVCVFRKPTGASGKGLYELKQECYSQYSPYYYHYTRTEQAKVSCIQLSLFFLIFIICVLDFSACFRIIVFLASFLDCQTFEISNC